MTQSVRRSEYGHSKSEATDGRNVTAFQGRNYGCFLLGHHTDGRSRPLLSGQAGTGRRPHRNRLLYRGDRSLLSLKPVNSFPCSWQLGPRGVKVERWKEQASAAGEMIP